MRGFIGWVMAPAAGLLVLCVAGCGAGPGGSEGPSSAPPPDTLTLEVVDTLGLEMGDSCYVFGQLMAAGHDAGGRILLLDMQTARISVFSPDGAFIGTVGAPGPGPGEFQVPLDFATFPEGGLAVTDAISRVISLFDAQDAYTGMLSGFFPTPPMRIEGAPGGGIVGMHMPMVMTGETLEMSMNLARWEGDPEPSVTYLSRTMELDLSAGEATAHDRGPEFEFAVGPDGNVYASEVSDTLLQVLGFTPEGEEFLRIEEPMERVPMTQEEIDAGGLALSIMVSDEGASADMGRAENTYPWRNIASSVGVDAQGRIWVEMACYDQPLFRVYAPDGTLLFLARPDGDFPQVGRPAFRVDAGGILAYDRDPVDWPKVYVLELAEA